MVQPGLQVNRLIILNITAALFSLAFIILQAEYFGASREIEIYFISQGIVHIILGLLQANQIGPLFLPIYHKLSDSHSREMGYKAFSVILTWVILLSIPLVIFAMLVSKFLIENDFLGYEKSVLSQLSAVTIVMIPTAIPLLINFIIEVFHSANSKYGRGELMVGISTLISIISLVILYETMGMWSLVFGWWTGSVIRLLANIYFLFKMDFKYIPALKLTHFDHRSFFMQVYNSYIYSLSHQAYQLCFLSLVTFFPPGAYAVYKYVENLYIRVQRRITDPVNTVFYTDYSQALLLNSHKSKLVLNWAVIRILSQSILVMIVLMAFREDILKIVWGSNIGQDNLLLGVLFLGLFGSTLIPNSIFGLTQKLVLANGFAKPMYRYLAMAQVLNILFIIPGFAYFGLLGLKSIILFFSFSQLFMLLILTFKRRINLALNYGFKRVLLVILTIIVGLMVAMGINELIHVGVMIQNERLNTLISLTIKLATLFMVLFIPFLIFKSEIMRFLPKRDYNL